MHFLIVLALIGCFFIFPGFRKVIASFLFLAAIGFSIIYGPLIIISGIPPGYGNSIFWIFFVVIGFIVFYAFVYGNEKKKEIISNPLPGSKVLFDNPLNNKVEIDPTSWNQAIDEFEGENRNRGLYAELFAETQGDESKLKAKYIQIRAKEIQETISKDKFSTEQINVKLNNLDVDYSSIQKNKDFQFTSNTLENKIKNHMENYPDASDVKNIGLGPDSEIYFIEMEMKCISAISAQGAVVHSFGKFPNKKWEIKHGNKIKIINSIKDLVKMAQSFQV